MSPIFWVNILLFMTCSQEALSQMSTTNVVEVWQPEDADPFVPLQVIITSILCLYQQPRCCAFAKFAKSSFAASCMTTCAGGSIVFSLRLCHGTVCVSHTYVFHSHLNFLSFALRFFKLSIYLLGSFCNVPTSKLKEKKTLREAICHVAPYFLLYIVSIVELTQLYTSEHARNERPRLLLSGFCKHYCFAPIASSWLLNAVLLDVAQE